jgi:diguanylate cyclase (GGDEF)-like protein
VARDQSGSERVLDLSDAETVRRVRITLQSAFLLIGSVMAALVCWTRPGIFADRGLSTWSVIAGFAVLGGAALVVGRRAGDLGFVVLSLSGVALGAFFMTRFDPDRISGSWELALLNATIMTSVFCERRRYAVLAAAGGTGATCAVALQQSTGDSFGRISSDVITMITVTFVVRALRETAESALRAAHQGEVTDPLTGLSNRRGLERWGERSQSDQDQKRSLAAIVIDLDHFKQVNDSQGHAAGDALLVRLADLLRSQCRPDDVLVRLGGEEFLVIAPVTLDAAVVLAERLRGAVEAVLDPVTASIGVAKVTTSSPDEWSEALWRAIEVADQALYEAKRSGRNRVVSVLGAAGGAAPSS